MVKLAVMRKGCKRATVKIQSSSLDVQMGEVTKVINMEPENLGRLDLFYRTRKAHGKLKREEGSDLERMIKSVYRTPRWRGNGQMGKQKAGGQILHGRNEFWFILKEAKILDLFI